MNRRMTSFIRQRTASPLAGPGPPRAKPGAGSRHPGSPGAAVVAGTGPPALQTFAQRPFFMPAWMRSSSMQALRARPTYWLRAPPRANADEGPAHYRPP